jgi:alpha-2-macroglobulin
LPVRVQIPVTSGMTPTAYLHVDFIQAWKNHTNHRPLRLFGIQALEVYDPATVLQPVISMQDEIEAEQEFEIKIVEQEGRPMSYTLAIVDEGLLQLTQFKTPNPWKSFFAKERLDVKTWDMYRHIFHRFQGESNSLLAVGGDGINVINPSSKAQRFKPVVRFIGPVKLAPSDTASHKMKVSDYVGAVRVMVVATNGVAVGKTDKSVEVKKPLMLYSTLPKVLGPGERLKVPVTLFVMDVDISTVDLGIASDKNISFLGEERRSIQFDKPGERDTYFEIEVGEKTGPVVITTLAQAGAHTATERIKIDVRPSSPILTKTIQNIIAPGESVNIEFDPIGMAGTQTARLSVSKGLNFSFQQYAAWLARYPHGCLEQSVSSVFPQIFLSQMNLLDDAAKLHSRQNYEVVIQKLRYMQLPSGGFSYWPGGNTPNSWGTTYALNFLLEAKNLGYRVPEDLLSKCVQYQYKTADSWSVKSTTNSRWLFAPQAMDQAYRLYTLALAGRPNYAALNRLRLVPRLVSSARWLLSHSLLLVGEKSAAEQAISAAQTSVQPYREHGRTFGSDIRDQAMIIRVLLARGEKLKAKRLIDEMIPYFNGPKQRYLSTQDVAQCLISFAMFSGSLAEVEDTAECNIKLSEGAIAEPAKISDSSISFSLSEEAILNGNIAIHNSGTLELFSSLEISGLPLRDESAKEMQDLELSVEYFSSDGAIVPVEMLQGSDFIVRYTVKHPGFRADYENMALTAIFPSGWEIINDRLNQNTPDANYRLVDYMDIRDDRINLYFDLKKGRSKTFTFKLNATYSGRYWAPPVFCEAMYDGSVRAKSEGFWVEIESVER